MEPTPIEFNTNCLVVEAKVKVSSRTARKEASVKDTPSLASTLLSALLLLLVKEERRLEKSRDGRCNGREDKRVIRKRVQMKEEKREDCRYKRR